jgi:hypothetical protein
MRLPVESPANRRVFAFLEARAQRLQSARDGCLGPRLTHGVERVLPPRATHFGDSAVCGCDGVTHREIGQVKPQQTTTREVRKWRQIEPIRTVRRSADEGSEFLDTLEAMYSHWADRRGMHVRRLGSDAADRAHAVSGLACSVLLEAESGLHIFSSGVRDDDRESPRHRTVVHVCATAWSPGPEEQPGALVEKARVALEAAHCPTEPVRRYRTGSAPLVRDTVRGYRTGRLGDVLSGDFDLF